MQNFVHEARYYYTNVPDPVWYDGIFLTFEAKALYTYLITYTRKDVNVVFPSFKTMRKQLGLTDRKITNVIKQLVNLGLIKVERRIREDGGKANNHYTIFDVPDFIVVSAKLTKMLSEKELIEYRRKAKQNLNETINEIMTKYAYLLDEKKESAPVKSSNEKEKEKQKERSKTKEDKRSNVLQLHQSRQLKIEDEAYWEW